MTSIFSTQENKSEQKFAILIGLIRHQTALLRRLGLV